jgi:cytochrome c
MRTLAAFLSILLLVTMAGMSQEQKPPVQEPKDIHPDFKVPPEEAARPNPVKPTEASLAEGKKLYTYQCAMCHGETGDGKGELVEPMKLVLKDWRDPASLKEFTDGALFYIISKGKGKMPDQQGRMKDDQKWHLINHIRSLAKKAEAEKAKTEEKKP